MLYIVNKKAQEFEGLKVIKKIVLIEGADARFSTDKVRVCLYCELLRNITLVIDAGECYKLTFLMENDQKFQEMLAILKEACKNTEIVEQNKKINGYASGLVKKIKAGMEIDVRQSTDKVNVPICPECGMQCDPDIPYCMECGAMI